MSEKQEFYNQPEKNKPIETSLDTYNQTEKEHRFEKSSELSREEVEKQTEKARSEVSEAIIKTEKNSRKAEKEQSNSAPSRRGPISKKQKNESYKKTIKQVQNELPVGSRTFSKIIHNKVIESASEKIGSTIARPNAMLSGALLAFIFTLVTYVIAKKSGYVLSGFETIGSFALGWLVGIVFDYLRVLITGKK